MVFPILCPVQLRTRPFYRLFNYRHSPRGQGIHRFQEMGEGSGAEVRLTIAKSYGSTTIYSRSMARRPPGDSPSK